MVAETIELPNLRKMFIPDTGYTIIDCDLERADAQVVAWDAGDEELKQMFREGIDVHTENAKAIFHVKSCTKEQRNKAKAGVHAVNYFVQARTLSATLGITVKEADDFINRWLDAHPAIRKWHERIAREVQMTRSIKNAFGYRYYIFERVRDKDGSTPIKTLQESLAWIPQSTVAHVTNRGLKNIDTNLSEVELLLQVHDSLVMQVLTEDAERLAPLILREMVIEVPYPDPLHIPVGLDLSTESWGDVKSTFVNDNVFYYKDEKANPTNDPEKAERVWLAA